MTIAGVETRLRGSIPVMPDDPPYTCRNACIEDLECLVGLLAEDVLGRTREQIETPLPTRYADALNEIIASDTTMIMLVEANGEAIGAMQLTFTPHLAFVGQRRATFESVHVAQQWRGKGAGEALVRGAIAEATRRGCGQIALTSSNSRTAAHRFWKRMGFDHSHLGFKLFLRTGS